jgi:hypothetical protein
MIRPSCNAAQPTLVVAGGVVILTGPWLDTALTAVLVAERTRRLKRLPDNPAHRGLAAALRQAKSAGPPADKPKPRGAHSKTRWLTTEEAGEQMGCTERHARRMAPLLDGDRSTGRWLIPQDAIAEHIEGRA